MVHTPTHHQVDLTWNDRLDFVFACQRALMDRYHAMEGVEPLTDADVSPDLFDHLQARETQLRLHALFGYLVRELSEAMQELPASKSWKQSPGFADGAKFLEEMADCLHFFVEMCIVAGISAADLFAAFENTFRKNTERQKDKSY